MYTVFILYTALLLPTQGAPAYAEMNKVQYENSRTCEIALRQFKRDAPSGDFKAYASCVKTVRNDF